MKRTLAAISTSARKEKQPEVLCILQARSELVSLGGAVLLALCVFLSVLFFMIYGAPTVTATQKLIAGILLIASWAYFFNSITERLSLSGKILTFKSLFSTKREIPLDELEAMLLTHEGFNLERGIETIELRRVGRRPDRISLGPCWQRRKLEGFLESVGKALREEV